MQPGRNPLYADPPAPVGATRPGRAEAGARRSAARRHVALAERLLGSYVDLDGSRHELLAWNGAANSTLVVDRREASPRSPLLVAHLAADEPAENAEIVAADYLERARTGRCRCRPLGPDDLRCAPALEEREELELAARVVCVPEPRSGAGDLFVIAPQPVTESLAQLRWWRARPRCPAAQDHGLQDIRAVSLREAVGVLESYEPLRAMTRAAIERAQSREGLSTTMLRAELARVQRSPIVLNRALREAVLASVQRAELSMSEIAIRCGRVKHDCRGNASGETSWLARRLGLLPEGGQSAPTPWVHSDVLGLIARRGLGIAPREVEL
jgi:hypothetical protein